MQDTVLLTGAEVRALLPIADCIDGVEAAFLRYAQGGDPPPAVLGVPVRSGGFHVKAAALQLDRHYFAAKLNANFPDNPTRSGLPAIQGIVALCDAADGRLLALMDSSEITRLRTGAATAVAAKYLARPDSSTLTLFGCGRQGRAQLECLRLVLPLARVYAHDSHATAAESLAEWAGATLGLAVEVVDAATALVRARSSQVIVTCTPSRHYFVTRAQVSPGTFVAGVGADAADKQELEPELLASGLLVTDVLEQCAASGDLHHAIAAGVMRRDDVHADLAELVAGTKRGRTTREEITVFDSTGTALEDVAAAALTYQRALASGRGTRMCFAIEAESARSLPCNG